MESNEEKILRGTKAAIVGVATSTHRVVRLLPCAFTVHVDIIVEFPAR